MPRVSQSGGGGTKRARADEAEAEALARLTTVPLKLAGVLYAATDGGAMLNVKRDELLAPLEAIGCDNPSNATQKNRIEHYPVAHWFAHNGATGADARIGLAQEGVEEIHALFTNDDDDTLDQDGLDALARAIHNATATPVAPAAAPLSQRKQPRAAPSPAATEVVEAVEVAVEVAVEEVEVEARAEEEEDDAHETDEEDDDDDKDSAIPALQQRVNRLAKRFDERVPKDSLAVAYGKLAATFFTEHSRVPTSHESDALVREARDEIYAGMEMGDGKVKHSELCAMFASLEKAAKLAAEVRTLEERASTAK